MNASLQMHMYSKKLNAAVIVDVGEICVSAKMFQTFKVACHTLQYHN